MVVPPVRRKRGQLGKPNLVSKLDLAMIVASIAGAVLWIEHGHQIFTDAPTHTDLSSLAAAAVCPDSDNIPYSASCIAFMQGGVASDMRGRVGAEEKMAAAQSSPKHVELISPALGAACPDNENTPYSASCIAYLTGWFWQPNAAEGTAPASAYTPN